MKRFLFNINVGHVLSVDDIWPDGDAPANPTVEDVRTVFLRCNGLRNWDLVTHHDVCIEEEVK